jgi:hypothetical protein
MALYKKMYRYVFFLSALAMLSYDMYLCLMGLQTVSKTRFVVAFSSFTNLTGPQSINLDMHHVSYLKEILLWSQSANWYSNWDLSWHYSIHNEPSSSIKLDYPSTITVQFFSCTYSGNRRWYTIKSLQRHNKPAMQFAGHMQGTFSDRRVRKFDFILSLKSAAA